MRRVDYFDDPDAPEPNSLVPAASAIVSDDEGRILLLRRSDNDLWALPGGAMELGESIAETAVREVEEETGLIVKITGLVGIYTDPRHIIAYADGEVRQQFNVCFTARVIGGQLSSSRESTESGFFEVEEAKQLPMHHTTRLRICHYLENRPAPYVG